MKSFHLTIRILPGLLLIFAHAVTLYAQKDYGIHDPAGFVKENDRYYTFYTSNGVECAYSTDLCTWNRSGKIFPSGFPDWIKKYVSNFGGHFWAPQVFFMNNLWHVYYSCSSFGSRGSAIGLATSPSLKDPQWKDQGMVVYTNNSSDHNAIDPALLRHDGKIWFLYGSFWSGIVMTELDSTTGKPIDRNDLHYLANKDPEAVFALHHGEYYYLFFNRGKCCDGVNSTYYINVGRAKEVTGPYLDKNGKSTGNGGGTVILKTEGRFIGPGHFGYFEENDREFMSYHYYDRDRNGQSKLKVSALSWEDGWPVVNTGYDPCTDPPTRIGTKRKINSVGNVDYVKGTVMVDALVSGTVSIRLYSLSGKLLLNSPSQTVIPGKNRLKLNTSKLPGGIYLLIFYGSVSTKRHEQLISVW